MLAADPLFSCLTVLITVHTHKAENVVIVTARTTLEPLFLRISLSRTRGLGRSFFGLLILHFLATFPLFRLFSFRL